MYILAFNTQHDGGCCLVKDGSVRYAISEERLTRRKAAGGAWNSIRYCLSAEDIRLSDVGLCVASSYGDPLPARFDYDLSRFGLAEGKCVSVDHHLSHAYSAYFTSGFEEALVVVADGTGNDGDSESYYVARGTTIEKVGGNRIKQNHRGLGKTYEAFTSFLGWTMGQSANTMALAAYGDRNRFKANLFEPFEDQVNGQLPMKYLQGVMAFAAEKRLDFGPPFGNWQSAASRDVAAYVQAETERALISVIGWLLHKTKLPNVCLGGGVALNCVANRTIRDQLGVNLHVVPAASDKGQCLGNALFGWYTLLDGERIPFPATDSWGKNYSNAEIERVLSLRQELGNNFIPTAPSLDWSRMSLSELLDATVERLIAGDVVAWMQGEQNSGRVRSVREASSVIPVTSAQFAWSVR